MPTEVLTSRSARRPYLRPYPRRLYVGKGQRTPGCITDQRLVPVRLHQAGRRVRIPGQEEVTHFVRHHVREHRAEVDVICAREVLHLPEEYLRRGLLSCA